MNNKKVISFMSLILLLFYINTTSTNDATEMTVDVGIEFSEGDPQTKPDPKPEPKPEPKVPIKKVIHLPQTGERASSALTTFGTLLFLGSIILIFIRKREVTKG